MDGEGGEGALPARRLASAALVRLIASESDWLDIKIPVLVGSRRAAWKYGNYKKKHSGTPVAGGTGRSVVSGGRLAAPATGGEDYSCGGWGVEGWWTDV